MNKHERDQYFKRIILDCTDHDYMKECGYKTLVDAQQKECPRHGKESHQKAMANWLQGLPSACTLPFYNWEILEMLEKAGVIDDKTSEKKKDDYLMGYWDYMAAKVIQIANGYHVPKIEEKE